MPTPNLAQLTLEHWRTGARWRSRLANLAEHFARVYNQDATTVYEAALALTWPGEVREG